MGIEQSRGGRGDQHGYKGGFGADDSGYRAEQVSREDRERGWGGGGGGEEQTTNNKHQIKSENNWF